MKNFLVVTLLCVFLFAAPSVHAFTVKDEVQVVPSTSFTKSPPPEITKQTLNSLLAASRRRIEATVKKEGAATARAIIGLEKKISAKDTATAGALNVLGKRIHAQETAINDMGRKVGDLLGEGGVIDTLNTRINDQTKAINNVGTTLSQLSTGMEEMRSTIRKENEQSSRTKIWLGLGVLLLCIVIAGAVPLRRKFIRSRKINP